MKKIVSVAILSLLMTACGDKGSNNQTSDSSNAVNSTKTKKVDACDVLNKPLIETTFNGATEIKIIKERKDKVPDSIRHTVCSYTFTLGNEIYSVGLILQAANDPYTEVGNLAHYVKYTPGSKLISGVGEKAYYSEPQQLLNAYADHSLIQVNTSNKGAHNHKKYKEISTKIAIKILEQLAQK